MTGIPASSIVNHLIVTCVLFLHLVTTATGQTWAQDGMPTNSSVQLRGSVRLRCRFENRGNSQVAWTKKSISADNVVSSNILFINTASWTDNTRYSIEEDVNGYDLVISDAELIDDAWFKCELQGQGLSAEAFVTVLVPPSTPAINYNSSDPLTEGSYLRLDCSTTGGNPAPNVVWRRNSVLLSDGISTTSSAAKFGSTHSTLDVRLTHEDHQAAYECEVTNAAVSTPVTATQRLAVQFKPVISFGEYNPLIVEEGQEAILECSTYANPALNAGTDVQWTKDRAIVGSGPILRMSSVLSSQAGEYVCTATNSLGETRQSLVLDVQYAPKVSITYNSGRIATNREIQITEESRLNVTCIVDANPKILNQPEWRHGLDGVPFTGYNFVTEKILRQQSGNYTCFAENTITPSGSQARTTLGKAWTNVKVQYGPGAAKIQGPEYVIRGNPAVLVCDVKDMGEPKARIMWRRIGSSTVIQQGESLTFDPVELIHNDKYTCSAENSVEQGTADVFTLTVNEFPQWQLNGDLPPQQTVVNTQRHLKVVCNVRGRPVPSIRWFKQNLPIGEGDDLFTVSTKQTLVDNFSYNVTSALEWKGSLREPFGDSLRVEDAGLYSCRARSDISQMDLESTLQLTVQYAPVLSTDALKVATDINQTAILVCKAQGVPSVSFQWYNGTQALSSSNKRVSINENEMSGNHQYQSTLEIRSISLADLGIYQCVGRNSISETVLDITVTVKTSPDSPSNLQVLSTTWESALLAWQPGFDGGYTQSYVIEFASAIHSKPRTVVQPGAEQFNLTGLYPNTVYSFKIYAENILGASPSSNSTSTVTKDFSIAPPTDVFFHEEERMLSFKSPSTNYCVKVEIMDGISWSIYVDCARASGGALQISSNVYIEEILVSLCLERRPEICSDSSGAMPVVAPREDLPAQTIIIVACICGTIVLVLLIILLVLCYRRHCTQDKDDEHESQMHHMQNRNNHSKDPTSFDNPNLTPESDNGGVFITDNSNNLNGGYMVVNKRPSNGHAGSYPSNNEQHNPSKAQWNASGDPPPNYRDVTELPHSQQRAKRKSDNFDHHQPNRHDNFDNSADKPKPKKVIYEVVV